MFNAREKIDTFSDVPLRELMSRVGQEMGDLAGAVHRIQSLVGLLLRTDALHEGKNVHELQSLDLIAQKIECLSDFLGALSQDVPEFWRIDTREAARLMALSELVARLTFDDNSAALAEVNAGDFEAF